MSKKINLPKAYMHTGVTMGPGDVDVEAEMKKAGHGDDIVKQAEADLAKRVEEHKAAVREGTVVPQAPITPELKEVPADPKTPAAPAPTTAATPVK